MIKTLSKFSVKQLFLIDALGALLSAFLLGVVLVRYESVFGIPKETLYLLASFPIVFAVYDLICYFSLPKNRAKFLRIIAIANFTYCLLSLGLCWRDMEYLSIWGWAYIIGEVMIVLVLASLEIKVAKNEPK